MYCNNIAKTIASLHVPFRARILVLAPALCLVMPQKVLNYDRALQIKKFMLAMFF